MSKTECCCRDAADLRAILDVVKTTPLQLDEIAEMFSYSRRRINDLLRDIPGVEKVAGRYRLPLSQCPPHYLIEIGIFSQDRMGHLLQATQTDRDTVFVATTNEAGGSLICSCSQD